MKTFKQLQESICKALVKFGAKGLRKVVTKAVKKGGSKKILDATARRVKMDKLIVSFHFFNLNSSVTPTPG